MKNEIEMLNLINKMQAQLSAMDRKIDTLMSRSVPEARPVLKSPINIPALPPKSNDRHQERMMFTAICADCKKECTIPFKPNGDRPVYCKDCFSRRKMMAMAGMKVDEQPKEVVSAPTPIIKTVDVQKSPAKKKKAVAVKKTISKKKPVSKKKR